MKRDDVFLHIQAGAGGYGDPLEREPGKVLLDVVNELITANYAADVYGVIIANGDVDEAETFARRQWLVKQGSLSTYLDHFAQSTGTQGLSRRSTGLG